MEKGLDLVWVTTNICSSIKNFRGAKCQDQSCACCLGRVGKAHAKVPGGWLCYASDFVSSLPSLSLFVLYYFM